MGLTNRPGLAIFLFLPGLLAASPKLRLSASTVGPISIVQGANGATQAVEAFNIGDSSLSLSLASSVPWIVATAGTQRACASQAAVAARANVCTPLQFALNTSGLAAGITTGIVTVSDPNAGSRSCSMARAASVSRSPTGCASRRPRPWRRAIIREP